jgi:hypothetical protein
MLWSEKEDGAPGGIRTPDLLIRSQLLYPLSYGRVVGIVGDGDLRANPVSYARHLRAADLTPAAQRASAGPEQESL